MAKELYLILDNIRSAYNVGAIFRTADGAGVKKIYLCGYSAAPAENTKTYKTQAEKMIEKTALGAQNLIAWEKCENLFDLLKKLREDKINIIALEQDKKSVELKKYKSNFPLALILGNEVEGIAPEILKKCDAIVSIPMRGQKESLNVSVAAGIAIYEILA
jgi:23S rRNA (guanosine2251-2'-O)-methyltransferase